MKSEQVVVITGASRGIGAQAASLFAEHGYAVCINYKSNQLAAENLKDKIVGKGGRCIAVKADVSVSGEVERLFAAVDRELGNVTALVNNVGILRNQCRLDEISEARFLEILQINVVSCFLCCKQAIKRMSTKYGGSGGVIVNVSSGASQSGSPNEYVDYAASKGAMDSLTRGLALEVASEGIRVNAVRPGLVFTEIHALGGEPDRVKRLEGKIPLGRGGQAKEVAEAIYWLSCEKSSYVTGSFVDARGGL